MAEYLNTKGWYYEYRKTPLYLAVRDVAMQKAGGKCKCGSIATEAHHKDGIYPPWNTWDVPSNLQPRCHRCHSEEHGKEN